MSCYNRNEPNLLNGKKCHSTLAQKIEISKRSGRIIEWKIKKIEYYLIKLVLTSFQKYVQHSFDQ